MSDKRILIAGDVMLDRYWFGEGLIVSRRKRQCLSFALKA